MVDLIALRSQFKTLNPNILFYGFDKLDSTNEFLKSTSKRRLVQSFCIANEQVQGKGQRGRVWASNEHSLTFSLLLRVNLPVHHISGLSIMVGMVLKKALTSFTGSDVKIKWPNDLYVEGKKVGGILIETAKYSSDSCWLIIGIGLNFSEITAESNNEYIPQLPCGFLVLSDKNNFLIRCSEMLSVLCKDFSQGQFIHYIDEYSRMDYFKHDEPVIVYHSQRSVCGLYKGLDSSGAVLVQTDKGIQSYCSGSVSIRLNLKKINE